VTFGLDWVLPRDRAGPGDDALAFSMTQVPTPLHYWLVALGKTAEWLIRYAAQPGDAAGASVEVVVAQPQQQQQEEPKNG
jgi:hypothetical protein